MSPPLADSDVALIAGAIAALATTGGIIATLVMQILARQEAERVRREALQRDIEIRKVQVNLDQTTKETSNKLEVLKTTSDTIHTLVNNNMGVQLKLNAELSRWKANQTKDSADVRSADEAERLYHEHMDKQAAVDKVSKGIE